MFIGSNSLIMSTKTFSLLAAAVILLSASCSSQKQVSTASSNNFPAIRQNGKTAVVAHRGFWNCEAAGYCENTIAALKAAQDAGFWGCELDVHLTADNVVVVNHDNAVFGMKIWDVPYSKLYDHHFKNGETVPTLDDYLSQVEKCKTTVIVCEFKIQENNGRDDLLIEKTVELLKAHNLFDPKRVAFISFGRHICDVIAAKYPRFINQYLSGKTEPSELAKEGINGIDYHYSNFYVYDNFTIKAHGLGMSVNAWTVDKEKDIQNMINLGVDAITTNNPLLVRSLLGDKEFKLKKK